MDRTDDHSMLTAKRPLFLRDACEVFEEWRAEALAEGIAARDAGEAALANPYGVPSDQNPLAAEWLAGWRKADNSLRTGEE